MNLRGDSASPPIIGVTGGIASGKSTVAELFAELDIPYVDADECAREVVQPGSPALQEIRAAFGAELVDAQDRLDRAALRQRIFADSAAREQLEDLLHPRIRELMRARLNALAARVPPPAYVLAVIPLLIESGQHADFDRLLVVHVDPAVQLQRLLARDGSNREQAEAILASQCSPQRRLALADDVIDNSDGRERLRDQVERIHRKYLGAFSNRRS